MRLELDFVSLTAKLTVVHQRQAPRNYIQAVV